MMVCFTERGESFEYAHSMLNQKAVGVRCPVMYATSVQLGRSVGCKPLG